MSGNSSRGGKPVRVVKAADMALAEVRFPAFGFTGECWVLMGEERQANTVDLYWEETASPWCDHGLACAGADAWLWDAPAKRYLQVIQGGRLLSLGHRELSWLLHRRPAMIDCEV